MEFSERRFLELSGWRVDEYFEQIEKHGRKGLSAEVLDRLCGRIAELDSAHACLLIAWRVLLGLPNAADFAVDFLGRDGLTGGEQSTMLKILSHAKDLHPEHIARVRRLNLLIPPDVLNDQFEYMHRVVGGR